LFQETFIKAFHQNIPKHLQQIKSFFAEYCKPQIFVTKTPQNQDKQWPDEPFSAQVIA
jgi:hypothetical protein